jgi:hypothetical protein
LESSIRIVVVYPDQPEPSTIVIPNTLESLQKVVGGHIEVAKTINNFIIVVNEEGLLRELPLNRGLYYGTFFITKTKQAEFISMTEEESENWESAFRPLPF